MKEKQVVGGKEKIRFLKDLILRVLTYYITRLYFVVWNVL
jgi:hypothetical protein